MKRRHEDSENEDSKRRNSDSKSRRSKDKTSKSSCKDEPKSRDRDRNNRKVRRRADSRDRAFRKLKDYHDLDKPDKETYPRYWGEGSKEVKDDNYSSDNEKYVGSRYYGDSKSKNKNDSEIKRDSREKAESNDPERITPRQRKTVDLLTSKTGGAYIPPAKLRMMQAEITDKTSAAYQRISWEALKKSIHGFINKVNVGNIGIITRELLKENIVRGRGLLCKSLIQAQAASPTFTHVYAALMALINSKFPNIGELLLKRLVLQFRRGFKRNDKTICITSVTFVAHLVNQRIAHEILALEILTLLVENPTDDSVEVAIAFLKECGQKLTEVSSKGINAIFEMLRNILHEGKLDKRVQYMIEVMFQVRKDGFKDHPAIVEELDLVEEDDQFQHLITLDDVQDTQDILNVFKFDPEFETNENKYKTLSREILGSDADSDDSGSGGSDESESEEEEDQESKDGVIIDNTETNLIVLRRTIYLTIRSSLDFEECAHKFMKMQLKPGQEVELCHMILDCCAEQRTYEKFFGLLAQRFCHINQVYVGPFEQIFKDSFATAHRLEINKLRNVSKFFAHLLFTDAIKWTAMDVMRLTEEDTTSSSRIFIKILFQELAEYMGLAKLNARLKDPTLQEGFNGLFPRDHPKNTRFAINFFTSIGLGGLTDDLREHLKSLPKEPIEQPVSESSSAESSSSSSSSSGGSSSSSSSSSSSDSSSSESEDEKPKRKTKKKNQRSKQEINPRKRDKSDNKKNKKESDSRRENNNKKRLDDKYSKKRGDAEENRINRRDIDSSRKDTTEHRSRKKDADGRKENMEEFRDRRNAEEHQNRKRNTEQQYRGRKENVEDRYSRRTDKDQCSEKQKKRDDKYGSGDSKSKRDKERRTDYRNDDRRRERGRSS